MMHRSLRVAVVDDHPLILEGITSLLRSSGHEVPIAVGDLQHLMEAMSKQGIDVLTLDIALRGTNGIEVARRVLAEWPGLRIVFVTQQTDVAYIRAAMTAGAHAFVSKQSAGTELMEALTAVGNGKSYISPGLLDGPPGLHAALKGLQHQRELLTPRQREVLQLIAEGKSVKEIAAALNIAAKTVEFHKQALVTTLGIKTTAELTRYAINHGLTFL